MIQYNDLNCGGLLLWKGYWVVESGICDEPSSLGANQMGYMYRRVCLSYAPSEIKNSLAQIGFFKLVTDHLLINAKTCALLGLGPLSGHTACL